MRKGSLVGLSSQRSCVRLRNLFPDPSPCGHEAQLDTYGQLVSPISCSAHTCTLTLLKQSISIGVELAQHGKILSLHPVIIAMQFAGTSFSWIMRSKQNCLLTA